MITDLKNLTISIEIIHYVQFIECLKAHKVIKDTGVDMYIYSKKYEKIHWSEQRRMGLGRYQLCFVKKRSKANMEKR